MTAVVSIPSSEPAAARDHRDLTIEDLSHQVVDLEAQVVALAVRSRALHEIVCAGWDYMHWLQAELCRARQWHTIDVGAAWEAELERRAKMRSEMAA